jgi:hypothetical protein
MIDTAAAAVVFAVDNRLLRYHAQLAVYLEVVCYQSTAQLMQLEPQIITEVLSLQ